MRRSSLLWHQQTISRNVHRGGHLVAASLRWLMAAHRWRGTPVQYQRAAASAASPPLRGTMRGVVIIFASRLIGAPPPRT